MGTVVVDTSILVAVARDQVSVTALFRKDDDLVIPTVVIAEFKAGLERMPPSKYKTKQLEIFEAVCGVAEIVVFGRNEASQYAVLYEQIKQAGRKMSEFDLAIAAHAVIKQATILTLDMNAKFDMLPGINVREL